MEFLAPSEVSATTHSYDLLSDARRKPPKSECVYRVGPAPREDVVNAAENSADIGTLDSDMENDQVDNKYPRGTRNKKAAGSRALIIYFAKMATKTNKERVDYRFLESLFQGGAQVNVTDKHGQTVLHEISRNWHTDVANFFINRGADVNKADKWGRSPLHLAAAVNHYEMVEYLLGVGANIHAKTFGEDQSPIHYATKYNAVGSLKVLIDHRAKINDRDYKQRTPVFLAAEMAREDTARHLVDIGVPVGVFDDTGMSAISLMVEKMPHIAVDALNQFLVTDTAFRKDYFYLNYLDYNPSKWRIENVSKDEFGATLVPDKKQKKKLKREKKLACPTSALQLAVQLQEFDVVMHPVMQQLIKQKWNLFGKWGAVIGALIHFFYIMIWTWLAIFLPKDGEYYANGTWWKIPLELLGVLLTLYFILKQIWESKVEFKDQQKFRLWRTRQLNRDMEYCHPRWGQEKTFLESEMKAVRSRNGGLLSDPWNILDFITYLSVLVVIVTRLVIVFKKSEQANDIHLRAYTAALIFMWLHFMKSCRPFTTLGPFITMLGHVMMDTITFAFLFFDFFIPYTIGFWILFGGPLNAKSVEDAKKESVDWKKFNDLVFSVWQVTLNVDFNFAALLVVDKLMAQIMVGSFLALSTVLCLNLYIALLSETFNRVYQNAKANASLLQANTILQIEKALWKKKKRKAVDYIQDDCGPLVVVQAEDPAGITDEELWDRTVRCVLGRFDKLQDYLKTRFNLTSAKAQRNKAMMDDAIRKQKYHEEKETYDMFVALMKRDKELYELQCDIHDLKCAVLTYLGELKSITPRPKYTPPPVLNIKPPSQELLRPSYPVQQQQTNQSQKKKNNELFRTIMETKPVEGIDVLQPGEEGERVPQIKLADEEEDLFSSWEDIPVAFNNKD